MIGTTKARGFSLILARSGSSQPVLHSQWLSRKRITSPVAALAPASLALIKPSLLGSLISLTLLGRNLWMYRSSLP